MTGSRPARLGTLAQRRERARQCLVVLRSEMPNPRCELYYRTPFQLLLSVILSAQATDKSVNRVMTEIYDRGFTARDLCEWGVEKFHKAIRTIGLAPTKAKNAFATATLIVERFDNKVPRSREDLESLPGVGRKTANVVLAELYGEPTLAVDTHVYRVTQRLGLHRCATPGKCEDELMKVVDAEFLPQAHHWFILHGRYVCKARAPECSLCSLNNLCPTQSTPSTQLKHNLKALLSETTQRPKAGLKNSAKL